MDDKVKAGASLQAVMTSLCVWEEMLRINALPVRDPGRDDGMVTLWHNVGASQMREFSIVLGTWIDEVYAAADGLLDEWPFDWEVVPALLKMVTWGEAYPITPVDRRGAALIVHDRMSRSEVRKFEVTILEHRSHVVKVEARSHEQAMKIADELYRGGGVTGAGEYAMHEAIEADEIHSEGEG